MRAAYVLVNFSLGVGWRDFHFQRGKFAHKISGLFGYLINGASHYPFVDYVVGHGPAALGKFFVKQRFDFFFEFGVHGPRTPFLVN